MGHTESSARLHTNTLLEMVDDGLLSEKMVMVACLNYMSDDEVREMIEMNEWLVEADVDDDEGNEEKEEEEEEYEEDEWGQWVKKEA